MAIWYILPRFATFLPVFGMLYQGKSGNPGQNPLLKTKKKCKLTNERNRTEKTKVQFLQKDAPKFDE
jgi:uncharacterized protein involved in type VI secretion and phage assembly